MSKKILVSMFFILLFISGCQKKEDVDKKEYVDEKEYIITEDIKMFIDITEDSTVDDIFDMMYEAEENGLGTFREISTTGPYEKYGEIRFTFNIMDEESKKSHDKKEYYDEVHGFNQRLNLDGFPVFKTSYEPATIFVKYKAESYFDKVVTHVIYYSEDNRNFSLDYDFINKAIVKVPDDEKCSKSEADKKLIEILNTDPN